MCGLKPALEIIVLWSICARLCNFVLHSGLETLVKLENYCYGGVAKECDKLSKLISVHVDVSLPLEVPVRFEGYECGGHLILWAEN
jgi:hypothetical protein